LPGSHHTLEERIDSIGKHYDPESSFASSRTTKKRSPKKAVLSGPAKDANNTCGIERSVMYPNANSDTTNSENREQYVLNAIVHGNSLLLILVQRARH
jgi:hypothetical protein